jgi:two-component system, OmpR family, copper resistance phosphate regulon response regulator CusR
MRILIVEDEIGIANFLQQGLEEEDFEVHVCYNGRVGMETAQKEHFDLILLDWMLPEINGLEICKIVRQTNQDTPIIFLTAKDTIQETIEGLRVGANDFIKKPFHFAELLERIKVHFRKKAGEDISIFLGPIILNTEKHTVTKNDKEIALTQKEFALLEMLIRNKNKVCTRTEIIEQVWDIHFDYNTGVIDVFINALRKKLELNENENYIQTIRGVGYTAKEL